MSELEQTERTRLRRRPDRGSYDRETLYAILDEALICHVGWVSSGAPTLIPTAHWRDGDRLYLHGSRASRLMSAIRGGAEPSWTGLLLILAVLMVGGGVVVLLWPSLFRRLAETMLDMFSDSAVLRVFGVLAVGIGVGLIYLGLRVF